MSRLTTSGSITLADFTGGETFIHSPTNYPTKYSALLQNAYITERRGVAKAPGYRRINNTQTAQRLRSGFEYKKSSGTTTLLVAGGGYIYRVNADGTYTTIVSNLNISAKVNFSMMNDLAIITNGVDAPRKWDGTTFATLAGTPPTTAFKSHVHKGRLWMIERTNKLLATHSALQNPENYTTNNDAGYIDFKFILKKGDELLDMATYREFLVFFFRNHIAIYSGVTPSGTSADFKLIQLIEEQGVHGTGTITVLGNDLIFLHHTGVKSLTQVVTTGNLNVGDVSTTINPRLKAEIRATPETEFSAAHYPELDFSCILVGDKIWVFNYLSKSWSRLVGGDFQGLFTATPRKMYVTGTGNVYEYGEGWSWHEKPMNWMWMTGWWALGKPGQRFMVKMAEIENHIGPSVTVKCSCRFDYQSVQADQAETFNTEIVPSMMDEPLPDIFDNAFFMDFGTHTPVRIPLFGGGKVMQMVFFNGSDKGPIEIDRITLIGKPGGI